MPRPTPIPPETRQAVLAAHGLGMTRNAIARTHGISAGSVSNIIRAAGLVFAGCVQTVTARRARQIDQAAARLEREGELWGILLETPYRADGSEPRRVRRASYALYDLTRKSTPYAKVLD